MMSNRNANRGPPPGALWQTPLDPYFALISWYPRPTFKCLVMPLLEIIPTTAKNSIPNTLAPPPKKKKMAKLVKPLKIC